MLLVFHASVFLSIMYSVILSLKVLFSYDMTALLILEVKSYVFSKCQPEDLNKRIGSGSVSKKYLMC